MKENINLDDYDALLEAEESQINEIDNLISEIDRSKGSIDNSKYREDPYSKKSVLKSPTPVNEEIELDPKKVIMSKTDSRGVIEYGNEYFVEVSGYKEEELIDSPHSIIRHPDMPRVVFKLMWSRLRKNENIYAIVKNLAKDGRFYWVLTDFDTKRDKKGKVISHFAYRRAVSADAIREISKLYAKLSKIEKEKGMAASERYLVGYLEVNNLTYDKYIDKLTNNGRASKLWFKMMRKLFS
jgi:PAS domain S-box-containing protein